MFINKKADGSSMAVDKDGNYGRYCQ